MPLISQPLSRVAFRFFATLLTVFSLTFTAAKAQEGELQINDVVVGTGDTASPYSRVTVHYTGYLMDGTKFDSSLDRDTPFTFILGAGQVIKGWDQGFDGMKIGGKRELIIPPHLGYGANGAGNSIPPNATLRFEVEMLGVEGPVLENISAEKLEQLQADGVTVVDIRRPDEWKETGVIPGAINLTAFDEQMRFIRSFPAEFSQAVGPNDPVIIICRSGNRSSLLSNVLVSQAGYNKVYNVADGIMDWIEKGKAIESYAAQ